VNREGSESVLILAAVAVVAIIVALLTGATMLMYGPMMGGNGMMGGGYGMGGWGVAVILVAVVVAVVALALALPSSRRSPGFTGNGAPPPAWPSPPPAPAAQAPTATPPENAARLERLQEAAVVKILDEDERRLYLQVREAGGTALQRDLVASGTFSKAKVTRLLDKLERKGLVARERYGATNRVRLTWKGPPKA